MIFTDMEADVGGSQRKVVSSRIVPAQVSVGDQGIPVRDSKSLPFTVMRMWSAPAGHYSERWFVVDKASREVLHEGPLRDAFIWGLQSPTQLEDLVSEPLALTPGTYLMFFFLGGRPGGEVEVEAFEAPER
jgi:hypothetical protein